MLFSIGFSSKLRRFSIGKIQTTLRLALFDRLSINLGTFFRAVGSSESGEFKIRELTKKWQKKFEENSVSEAEQSIKLILAHVLNSNLYEIDKLKEKYLHLTEVKMVEEMCLKRLANMPVQYILGDWDFRSLKLIMRPPVFIPRPETEELVEIILNRCSPTNFLELCCGSGAISLSLLQEWPNGEATAVDQSEIACLLTMENAQKHGLHNRIRVIRNPIHYCLLNITSKFRLIVSNPPYVFTKDLAQIQPEIGYEDIRALDGGPDGLEVIKQILSVSSEILEPEGKLFLEVDPRHPPMLENYLEQNSCLGLYYVKTYRDFCSKMRFVQINKTAR